MMARAGAWAIYVAKAPFALLLLAIYLFIGLICALAFGIVSAFEFSVDKVAPFTTKALRHFWKLRP